MQKTDVTFLTATELSEQIKAREVSPVEAVEAYLARIEDLNPTLNSYITVCAKDALVEAQKAEKAIAA